MLNLKKFTKLLKREGVIFEVVEDYICTSYVTAGHNSIKFCCYFDSVTLTFLVFGPKLDGDEDALKTKLSEACKTYKYWFFSMDDDRTLRMRYQMPLDFVTDKKVFMGMLESACSIVDDLMPELIMLGGSEDDF